LETYKYNVIKHQNQSNILNITFNMKLTLIATSVLAIAQAAPGYTPETEVAAVEAEAYAPPTTEVMPTDETAYVAKTPAECDGEILTIVEEGDTLDSIAQENDLNLDKLIAANPQFSDPDLIFPSDMVCVPKGCAEGGYVSPETEVMPTEEVAYIAKTPAECDGEILTIVEEGDTLDLIAQANELDLEKLIAANPQFSDPDIIFPSDMVCVPESCGGGYKPYTAPVNETLGTNTTTEAYEPEEESYDADKAAFLQGSGASSSAVSVLLALVAGSAVLLF
jgi:hypothetical protein